MNVLIYEWNNFGIEDVCDALRNMGHTYKCISDELMRERTNADFDTNFEKIFLSESFDCVFTFNFSPIISNNCKKFNVPYIAYIYDSPLVSLYSYTIINPCNYVFIFDKALYLDLKKEGIGTVYYMPLSANVKRLDAMFNTLGNPALAEECNKKYSCDISFVGSMYNEKHNLFDRMTNLKPFTKGYLDAIMDAQLNVYGCYFIEDMLNGEILKDMQANVPVAPNKDGVETVEYLYAYYFIARKLASKERFQILNKIALCDILKKSDMRLYTHNATPEINGFKNMGAVDYYNDMPYVFHNSRINLNITLRSIRSGIPLRGIDIMGAGGFLMSNYQEDFYDFFTPGEDLILYESQDDLTDKCTYYLNHENERAQIAANGYGKIKEFHTYEKHLEEMFSIVFA